MVLLQGVELTLKSDAGEINILRGIDLSVGIGESVGVVGPSGSGKTSMIMVIAGLERISSGRILVGNREISTLNEDALAVFRRDEIGVVFQSFHLIPTMTALENVAVPMELANRRDAFERAEQALRDVGLGHRIQHYPGQLSGGEQQRVALARAFAVEPNLLLADEPTGNLDGETGGHIVEMLFELAERAGTTLMLITHDNAIAERCDRIVRMVDGRLA
jgi:putative ABC transport system ATP-binding protein